MKTQFTTTTEGNITIVSETLVISTEELKEIEAEHKRGMDELNAIELN